MNEYSIRTNKLELTVAAAPLRLTRVLLRAHPEHCGALSAELFRVTLDGVRYDASSFRVTSADERDDGRYRLLRIELAHDCGVSAALSFLADTDDSIELILQLKDTSGRDARFAGLAFPFLSDGSLLGLKDGRFRAPAAPFRSSRGEPLLDLHPACRRMMSFVRDDGSGFDLSFDISRESNTRSCTLELPHIHSLEALKNYSTSVRLGRCPAEAVQIRFEAVLGGWPETFTGIRKAARAKTDLRLYDRPDLRWYRETFLHHFAYVYGEEVYDYRRGRVDIDRLLDAGEAFGGYDVICLWHQYPRLGVDARSQWDFFEDFPGGLAGLAAVVRGCHERGVRLMLPYKPWDAPGHMSPDDTAKALARLAAETDADGFFLDTMSDVPPQFRIEADRIRPGCVFCTELVPDNAQALELLTGSWQQTAPRPYQTPLLRYVFPEHRSHYISRWSIDAERDDMLKKAVMNGSGLVIWQDVFGAWLPYTDEQKAAVKRWKRIWLENKAYFLSQTALPLWPALQPDLIVNAFMPDDKTSAVFTVYNFSGGEISGAWFRHGFGRAASAEELWSGAAVYAENGAVCGRLAAGEAAVVKVLPDDGRR